MTFVLTVIVVIAFIGFIVSFAGLLWSMLTNQPLLSKQVLLPALGSAASIAIISFISPIL